MFRKIIQKIRRFRTVQKYRSRGVKIGWRARINGRIDGNRPDLVEIGNGAILGRESMILTHCIKGPAPVKIGHYSFIGYGAIILPGVTIGIGAIVGAGSVVTKNVDDFMIVAGNPARVIGKRGFWNYNDQANAIIKNRPL